MPEATTTPLTMLSLLSCGRLSGLDCTSNMIKLVGSTTYALQRRREDGESSEVGEYKRKGATEASKATFYDLYRIHMLGDRLSHTDRRPRHEWEVKLVFRGWQFTQSAGSRGESVRNPTPCSATGFLVHNLLVQTELMQDLCSDLHC